MSLPTNSMAVAAMAAPRPSLGPREIYDDRAQADDDRRPSAVRAAAADLRRAVHELVDSWHPATVPTTLLRALVKEGVYPDPKVGMILGRPLRGNRARSPRAGRTIRRDRRPRKQWVFLDTTDFLAEAARYVRFNGLESPRVKGIDLREMTVR